MTVSRADSRRSFRGAAVLLGAAFAVCATVQSAELQMGQWTGTVTPPNGDSNPATFTVGEADGQLQISISLMGMMLDFRDIELTDEGIGFTWSPGPDVRCQLALQEDRSYAGECTDQSGGTGYVTMVPPG